MSVVYPAGVVGIDMGSASNGPLGIVHHSTCIHYNSCRINSVVVDDSAVVAFGIHAFCFQRAIIMKETGRVDLKSARFDGSAIVDLRFIVSLEEICRLQCCSFCNIDGFNIEIVGTGLA